MVMVPWARIVPATALCQDEKEEEGVLRLYPASKAVTDVPGGGLVK